jgi:hypothetical protein
VSIHTWRFVTVNQDWNVGGRWHSIGPERERLVIHGEKKKGGEEMTRTFSPKPMVLLRTLGTKLLVQPQRAPGGNLAFTAIPERTEYPEESPQRDR